MSDTRARFLPSGLLPKIWLSDFTDSRVREEVLQALMKDNAVSFLTNVVATALFVWAHDFVRASVWFCALLLLWCGLAAWSYGAEIIVKRISRQGVLTAAQSWHFLRLYVTSSFLQTFCLAVILLFFMNHDGQGIKSFEVIGILFYYFGSVIKDFSIRLLNIAYTLILLLPIAVFYLLQGNGAGFVIAGFIVFFSFAAIQFANSMSGVMVSHIQQRFALEELTHSLVIERDRADAANAAKSQFFTAASHDARQPLQAISLLFDGLATSPTLSEPDRKVIDKVGANLHSIRNLFDRVLDISRIESGSITPHFQAIPLQHIFNALDAQFGEFAASKNLWLRFAPTQAVVWHDADLLERMVGNVIHNALKFTQSGGVWVGYRVKRGRLEVRDSGVGITEAEQARIFEEFYQLDNRARRRDLTAGLGLGLSIVKRLAELTHTPVGVRSAAGRGATFWLGLNAAPNQVHSPLAQLAPQAVPASIPIAAQLKDLAILLVEDDAELRSLLARLLSERGAHVRACADAPQAYQLLSATENAGAHFDVVLTDYRLGEGGSGADVVRSARQLFGETLPVVVLTGDTNGQGFQELTLKPYTQVLHKPVSIEQLVAVLQEAC